MRPGPYPTNKRERRANSCKQSGIHFIDLLTLLPQHPPLASTHPVVSDKLWPNTRVWIWMPCQPNKEATFEQKASRGGGEKLRIEFPHVTAISHFPPFSFSNRQSLAIRNPSASSHMLCRRRLAKFRHRLISPSSRYRWSSAKSVFGVFHGPNLFSVSSTFFF